MLTSKRHINLQKLQHKKAKLTAGRRSTSRMGIDSGEARADTSTNTNTHTHAWASQPSATFCGRCCRTTPWPDGLCGVQCCASCHITCLLFMLLPNVVVAACLLLGLILYANMFAFFLLLTHININVSARYGLSTFAALTLTHMHTTLLL